MTEKLEVIVYSSTGCPYCEKVKSALKDWGIEYEERNASIHKEYFDQLKERKIFGTPATFINGKLVLGFQEKKFRKLLDIPEDADSSSNKEKPTMEQVKVEETSIFQPVTPQVLEEVYDFVTIGGGPAGASAAVYAARGKLKTLVIDKAPKAGTLAITHKIANYPGVREELTGLELLTRMQAQAKDFGAEFVRSTVLSVDFTNEIKKIELAKGTVQAKSVFIAVGAKAPSNKIKGEEEFTGRGVSYCSTCDAAFYQDQVVAVVGDNEEAIHEAETLSKYCKRVKLLIPIENLKGDADLSGLENNPKVEIYRRHRLREIIGTDSVEKIVILNDKKEEQVWDADGVFLYLGGMKPGTDFLKGAVMRDEEGYVSVDELLQTSAEGVFAGGDARRTPIKQAVISAADGAIAAIGAEQHVNKRTKLRPQYS
ncbi:pyridine nucleotide-disulfide oxidoreductase [Bacillus salipaludis]|uniref:Pyridine nucleotide-disulfide oxidoreductase n=1 Tax=Bacillus salipaludis TaxID=2547811 RepID=A0A4R5VTX4_9BACI|nr:FAD-dependent oxidoreductase [Bacillus salipaludis]TDK62452.1 pyridine nucleotide-disulfide oxidoreductase [Bacillus salipaludis]